MKAYWKNHPALRMILMLVLFVLALVLVVYSVFPKVADACASLLGIYATTNFLFLFAIFVLILKVFFMSIHISQLESKIKELVQAMALEEKKYEEEKH